MQGNGKSKMKVAILVLSVLLAVSLLLLARTLIYNYVAEAQSASVTVPDNIITPEDDGNSSQSDESPNSGASVSAVPSQTPTASQSASQSASDPTGADVKATALSLYSRKPDDNTPFRVANLFPGDSETKYFCVRVSHKGDVLLRFHAQVRPGYEKLAEVLKCRVVLPESGEVLYDGRMRDMPESLSHALHTGASTTGEVYYAVTAYLDTGVGNAYILIPFLLLILIQGLNCIKLFRRYKREQMAEMQAEREKLEAERAESQKMMEELQALKAQLAEKSGEGSADKKESADEN